MRAHTITTTTRQSRKALLELIEVRPAHPDDERALTRLAQLDSARVPSAPLLLALEGGELRAALSLATGTAIADPFAQTASLVELLHARAAPPHRRRTTRSAFRRIAVALRMIGRRGRATSESSA
jgi:hypothetical protein